MNLKKTFSAATISAFLLAGAASATAVPGSLFDPPTAAEAREFMQRGAFEEAADAWAAILEANPDNATAWFNLGYSLHAQGRLDDAIKAHKKASTYDQFHGIALYNLGCAYALQAKTDAAIEALKASAHAGFDVKGNAPGDPDLDSLRDDPRFAALLGQTEQPAAAAPEQRPQASHRASGPPSPEEMQQLFQFVATRMQPIFQELQPIIQRNIQELLQDVQGRLQNVMGELQQRIHEDPELVEAIEQIHTALSEDPKIQGIMQKVKGAIQQRMGRRSGGMAPTASTAAAPEAAAIAREAQRLQSEGNHEAAAKAFGALVELAPDNGAARFGYAYNLHMAGNYEKAIAAHKAAAEFPQFKGIATYNLACAYALTGQTEAALQALLAAHKAGFDIRSYLDSDSDLESLRDDPGFAELKKAVTGR